MLLSVVVPIPTPRPPAIYTSPPTLSLAPVWVKVEVPIPTAPAPRGVFSSVESERIAKVPVAVDEVAKVREVEALFTIVEVDWLMYWIRPALRVRVSVRESPRVVLPAIFAALVTER